MITELSKEAIKKEIELLKEVEKEEGLSKAQKSRLNSLKEVLK